MKRTLLVVDDLIINREILKKILSDEYAILEASNGAEALSVMRGASEPVSAVLLDLVMPVMDGFTMLSQLRADPVLALTPVLVTTGQTEEASEVKALSLGANDYIAKPYNSTIIKQRIRNTINLRESAAAVNQLQRDKLTGLYNREYFFELARKMIDAQRSGYYTISSFNVSGFKVINDQYGTAKGDLILRHIADCVARTIALLGGACCRVVADQFAVLYPAEEMDAETISRCREEAVHPGCLDRVLGLRVGQYLIKDLSMPVSAMLDRAMIAEASVKGRYGVTVARYDESMRQSLLREQEIVNEMRGALAEGQFEVWFQPQFNHVSGAIIGAEALVRWRHPKHGIVPPGDFIPVFERNGFVYELDKYVWKRACRFLREWMVRGMKPLPVSVNVSRYDMLQDDVVEVLSGLPQSFHIPAGLLRLEVTESTFAGGNALLIDRVEALVQKGFCVEIDDFGSGYSSLNTLKDVPATVLKLDMRFLEDKRNSERGGSILESVVRMASWLGMPVIAEGVETVRQADLLKSIGCLYIQGYLYARPMPAGEYERFFAEYGDAHSQERYMSALETDKNLNSKTFWDPRSLETLIFNSYVGGACIYEYRGGQMELIRVNEHYAAEIGVEQMAEEGVRALDMLLFMDEKNAAVTMDCVNRAIATGGEADCEAELHSPGNARVCARLTMRVLAKTGSRCMIYCTLFNITDLRNAERREKDANHQMRLMVDDFPGGFCRMRVNDQLQAPILFVNDGFCRLVDMPRDVLMREYGGDALAGLHPEDCATVRQMFRANAAGRGDLQLKCRIRHGQEGYITAMLFGRVLRDEAGNVLVNAYYTKLTDQPAREGRNGAMLSMVLPAVMAYTSDLSFAKDCEYRYLCASDAFVKLVGLDSERELIGRTDYDLFDKAVADRYHKDDVHLMESGEPIIDLLEAIPSDDGVQHYSSTSKYLLRDEEGAVVGLYGVGRDVTEYHTAFERLQILTESIPGGLASFEATADSVRCTYFNEGFYSYSGYTKEEFRRLVSQNVYALIDAKDVQALSAGIQAIRRGERETLVITCRSIKKDGGACWITIKAVGAAYVRDARLVNVVQFDVTEDKQREEMLRMSEEQYRLAMQQSGNIMCRYDVADLSVNMPDEVAAYFNMPPKVVNVPYAPVRQGAIAPDSVSNYVAFYEGILRGQRTGMMEFECKTADGWRWMRARQSAVFSDDGRPVYAVVSMEDVTEKRRQMKERALLLEEQRILRQKADTDGMTGVFNKAAVETRIQERLVAPRNGLSVLIVADIDSLKKINDTYGHPRGDKAIRQVADLLENNVRTSDVVGRVGGDEFVIYTDGYKNLDGVRELLRKLLRCACQLHEDDDESPYISIGAAVAEAGEDDFEALYDRADHALYHAKRGGKRCYALSAPGGSILTDEGEV